MELILTRGQVAIIDDEDYDWLSKWKWTANYTNGQWRAYRNGMLKDGKRKSIMMHRQIMDAPDGMTVDHINGNTLDNRRSNLRICTFQENARNKSHRGGLYKFKGVELLKQGGKWRAYIMSKGRKYHLGLFLSQEEAAKEYDRAAIQFFGEFAKLNFPGER